MDTIQLLSEHPYVVLTILLATAILWFMPDDERSKELKGNFDSSFGIVSRFKKGVAIAGIHMQLSKEASYRSSATISGSGGGKTSSVLIPTIFQCTTASKVILDPKGEQYAKTSGFLSKDHKVEFLAFNSLDSLGYNPLKRAKSITDKYKLAHALFGKQSGHDFWENSGQNLCVLLWRIQGVLDEQFQTLGYTNQLLAQMQSDPKKLDKYIARNVKDPEIYNAYKAFISQDLKVQSNVISTVLATLKIFNDPIVNAVTSKDDIDLSALRKEKTALFIQSGLDSYYQPLVSCFFEQMFDEILKQYPSDDELDLLMVLEEFGSVYVPSFPVFISNCRANRVMLLYACQSLTQLENTYNKANSSTILDNTNNLIAFGRLSEDLAGQFSRRLGKWQFEDDKGRKVVKNVKEVDELMHLDPQVGILTSGSKRPMLVKLAPYYKYSLYNRNAKLAPVQFKGHLSTEMPYLDLDELNRSNLEDDV